MNPHDTATKIIDRGEAARWVRQAQAQGARVVFTNGCFDLLHVGHVQYLEAARALGDALIVAVNTDASVRRLEKGADRPINRDADRARLLAALAAVDRVVLFDEDTPREIIMELQPDVLVKGGDYREEDIVGRDTVVARGGRVQVIPFTAGYATTALLAKIRGQSPS